MYGLPAFDVVGLPFRGQECIWGDSPSFLSGPGEPPSSAQTSVRIEVVGPAHVTFTG